MTVVRAVALLASAVVGAVAGLLGTYAHLAVAGPGRWPVGLLLALALTASVALTLRGLRPVPGAMGALVAGWLVVVALAMSRRSEGDLLVVQNARGLAWLGLGVVVLVGVLVLPGSDAGASRG